MAEGEAASLESKIPKHAKIVIASDFLKGADVWAERLARLSGRPVSGVLLQVIDPAERDFPYRGRVKMRLPGLEPLLVGRAERAAENYRNKFGAHCAALADTARRLGWPLITHETDATATVPLTALHQVMSGHSA